MGYGTWLAAAFDAIANIALIFTFKENAWALGPQIALVVSYTKYLLVFLGVSFILMILVSWILSGTPKGQPGKAQPG